MNFENCSNCCSIFSPQNLKAFSDLRYGFTVHVTFDFSDRFTPGQGVKSTYLDSYSKKLIKFGCCKVEAAHRQYVCIYS